MSQKRQQEDGKAKAEGTRPEDKRRKFFTFRSAVQEVMNRQTVQHYLEPVLEPLIRRVVKEEVELALKKHLMSIKWSSGKEIHAPESRSLQLKFANNLSLPVFTGARIEGDDSTIKVALVDTLTGQIVSSGPESSAKVEIVVLEGDFDGDEADNWTVEEFKNNIVREREGKKPLLTGDPFFTLKEGIGLVGEISFTDNSSWTRSRRFRLGARVVDNSDGTRIREAKTESFIVRDHRGELYKKHHPPSLFDEVWRLEKIGKDGAFHKRLTRESILTVKDFLTLLILDPPRLRHILGTGMSAKMWEVTVDHARTCILDKRTFLYCPPGSQQKSGVVFNVVGQVMGLLSECQYVPVDKLSETEKAEAQILVITAYKHWDEVISFEDEASLMGSSSQLTNALCTSSSPMTDISSGSKTLASQKMGGYDYTQLNASSPDIISSIYSVGSVTGLDDYGLHSIENMGLRYDQTLSYPSQVSNSLICDTESITRSFCDEDHLRFFDTDLQAQSITLGSPADLQSAVSDFLRPHTVGKAAQMRWTKLFSVLKFFYVRKVVAKKTTPLLRYA
ncbi:calmodulin-binding protein 60 A isoform X1 [Pistacia vera]|uniref:calmodulin-binding protein 60 A isoform X1 n=2 Tax=Pistacia vera TaxID=55513 RepID=UPI001263CBF4|nr:calmodulin-binding protein 60 A isoform X1 [Pistacia vera]